MDGIEELSKKELTYAATLRKDKWNILNEFIPKNNLPVVFTLYDFRYDIRLLSYGLKRIELYAFFQQCTT